VLTDAAIQTAEPATSAGSEGRRDHREKLIRRVTGINRYRHIQVQPTEEARAAAYTSRPTRISTTAGFGQATGLRFRWDDYGYRTNPSCASRTQKPHSTSGVGGLLVLSVGVHS